MPTKRILYQSERLFRLIWLWSKQSGQSKTHRSRICKVLAVTSTLVILAICTSDMIAAIMGANLGEIFYKIFFVLAAYTLCHKTASAAYTEDEMYSWIKQMEHLASTFKDKTDIENCLRVYSKLFKIGLGCMLLLDCIFLITPITTNKLGILPFTPHFPFFDVTKTPNYQLTFLFEACTLCVYCSGVIAFDTLFCGMMSLCAASLSSICREIRNMDDCIDDHPASDAKMKETIDKINKVTYLISKASDIFSMTTMSHVIYICSGLSLCLYMVSSLPHKNLGSITMMEMIVVLLFQLWLYCYFGQKVVNQREVLQKELYFIRWYDASKNFKTMLIFTLFETQNNRYIYAGKVLPLSLEMMTEVIKKAYAFFTFLNESR